MPPKKPQNKQKKKDKIKEKPEKIVKDKQEKEPKENKESQENEDNQDNQDNQKISDKNKPHEKENNDKNVEENENKTNKEKQSKNKPKPEEEKHANDEEDALSILTKRNPKRWQHDPNKVHEFWGNQPVPSMNEDIKDFGAIEVKTLDDVRKDPLPLPSMFEWYEVDLKSDEEAVELYNLLANNYVEDDDSMFRFNYSVEFLRWALMVPGYLKTWHVGVRGVQKKKLCAFISAIPATVVVRDQVIEMVEINFLCAHKQLRDKRMAPVLIKEITRRVNLQNRWQAVYTAGVVIPKPIAQNRYWHRSLNPKKLIEIGFTGMKKRMTMPRVLKLYRIDSEPSTPGIAALKEEDCEETWKLLLNYLQKFKLHIQLTLEEFKHVLLPIKNVVYSYVVKDNETKKITDLISFYCLPSTVINNPKYNEMKAAYSYYNVSTKTPWVQLINDALVFAAKEGFDVFNALDVMENAVFFKELKFGIGDGHLQYYLYNWKCPELQPGDIGLVLL